EAPKLEGGIVSNPADAQSNKGAAESVIVH
ncbi:MAG: hypothetical protein FD130_2099, partial [Halothiobacillaceae bacterium]